MHAYTTEQESTTVVHVSDALDSIISYIQHDRYPAYGLIKNSKLVILHA
jgi:hypothetical protein